MRGVPVTAIIAVLVAATVTACAAEETTSESGNGVEVNVAATMGVSADAVHCSEDEPLVVSREGGGVFNDTAVDPLYDCSFDDGSIPRGCYDEDGTDLTVTVRGWDETNSSIHSCDDF